MAATELRLSTNAKLVRTAFSEWHEILLAGSGRHGRFWQIKGTDVRFGPFGQHPELHLNFWIGSATSSALQINEPRLVRTENRYSHIGVDDRGRRFLLRQGTIQGNAELDRVEGQDFVDRTGFARAVVFKGKTPAERQWHVVARLDGRSSTTICAETAEFVRRCWNARIYGTQAAKDQERLTRLLGKNERGGSFDIEPDPTPRKVLKLQGYVLEQLEAILDRAGIGIEKSRHADGYEVDAEIAAPGGSILVEVKTGFTPADVYCGIGQLSVYPLILDELADYPKVLLLPGEPREPLVKALESCQVELHFYELKRGKTKARAIFSNAFLKRCGLTPSQIAAAHGKR